MRGRQNRQPSGWEGGGVHRALSSAAASRSAPALAWGAAAACAHFRSVAAQVNVATVVT
jgi:hypothetical protein